MSTVFPKLGIINENIVKTLEARAGNNLLASKLMSWIRVSSAVDGGMVLETIPNKTNDDGKSVNSSFHDSYGKERQSGRVGLDFAGKSKYAAVEDRGFRPSPIIESITVENGTSGLSRKAKFSIICYTLPQAELITKHFLEPGYTVLVEFGWNLPESVKERYPLSPCYMASFNNYNFIRNKRVNSNGTYDGFMGFITGGSYASGDDETYIVDVELTTLGEIPSYLQVQKNSVSAYGDSSEEKKTGRIYNVSEIEQDRENSNTIGQGLFRQMYNELPSEKRTNQIKDILNENDVLGNPFSSEWNFINVDNEVREEFMKVMDLFLVPNPDGDPIELDIPSGLDFITDQSFIRAELAFKILNSYGINIESVMNSNSKCGGDGDTAVPSYDFSISTKDTIIGGHKHMFSTDITKLYIPNQNLPDFGLTALLTSRTEAQAEDFINVSDPKTTNGNIWAQSLGENSSEYEFPSRRGMNEWGFIDTTEVEDVRAVAAKANTWGYLRNLYINLNFFIEVITRPNFVAKDCYYEILNGISAAANSYWQFEIQENVVEQIVDDSPYKVNQMQVTDQHFIGVVSKDTEMPIFEPNGPKSPFMMSNINIDIPAAMKNSILGKRSSANVETMIDGKAVEITRFFSSSPDPVMEILDSFKGLPNAREKAIQRTYGTDAERAKAEDTLKASGRDDSNINENDINQAVRSNRYDAGLDPDTGQKKKPYVAPDEARKRNLEEFAKRGTLLLKVRDKNKIDSSIWTQERTTIGNDLLVGAFDDPTLLKRFEIAFLGSGDLSGVISNPSILAIEFSFETLGISGIKIGDTFKVNRLPKQYDSGIFQVMETSHNLSDGMWTTTVKAKLRNV